MIIQNFYKKYIGKRLILKMVLTVFSILVFYIVTKKINIKSIIKLELINSLILFIGVFFEYLLSKKCVIDKELNNNKYIICSIIFVCSNIAALLLISIFIKKYLIIKIILSYLVALISFEVSLFKINKKVSMITTCNVIFVTLFFIILATGTTTILVEKRKRSYLENRVLSQFSIPTLNNFKNNNFQADLENSLSDQYIYGYKIKEFSFKYLNFLDYKNISKKICSNRYVYLSDKYVTYNCDDYILNAPTSLKMSVIDKKLEVLNNINKNIDTYYYIINRAYSIDFENNKKIFDIESYFKDNMEGNYKMKVLDNFLYEDYTKYFYKTDHHWNNIGSQKGYREIHDLLGIQDEYLTPTSELQTEKEFYGSTAKGSKMMNYGEEFKFYSYKYKPHITYLNGKEGFYTDISRDTNKDYYNYYAYIYGSDTAEIEYDFDNDDRDNLLIIASSFSNPINEMIASHFNKTYVLDLRYLEDNEGNYVNLKKYIKWHDIDKVLVIASTDFLDGTDVKMEWID